LVCCLLYLEVELPGAPQGTWWSYAMINDTVENNISAVLSRKEVHRLEDLIGNAVELQRRVTRYHSIFTNTSRQCVAVGRS
jgi:hypothetical protein